MPRLFREQGEDRRPHVAAPAAPGTAASARTVAAPAASARAARPEAELAEFPAPRPERGPSAPFVFSVFVMSAGERASAGEGVSSSVHGLWFPFSNCCDTFTIYRKRSVGNHVDHPGTWPTGEDGGRRYSRH
ncbi:hypothetical protein CU254_08085 [Amycolatopsis sp. AA4]|nr:hypothetical protein CU254_08085 [Amycolatopsis sp. AA4]